MNARSGLALLTALGVAGCSKAWMRDESHRIDEEMRCPTFNPESREAHGIGLFEAAPQATPWLPGEKYELGAGGKQQAAKAKRKGRPR